MKRLLCMMMVSLLLFFSVSAAVAQQADQVPVLPINDQSSIEAYVREASVSFIIGRLDLDRDWNAYLSQLEALGQAEYRRMLQEDYDSYLSHAR